VHSWRIISNDDYGVKMAELNPWTRFHQTKPPGYGDYLVIQKIGPVCYQRVVMWTPMGWSNPQEEIYGDIVAWMSLPDLPEWL